MFTGIIIKKVQYFIEKQEKNLITIRLDANDQSLINEANIGDSVAVSGVCLTVIKKDSKSLFFHVAYETIQVTKMKEFKSGDWVNIELAMKAGDRFGGHVVSGHVDKVITVKHVEYIRSIEEFKDFSNSQENEECGADLPLGVTSTVNDEIDDESLKKNKLSNGSNDENKKIVFNISKEDRKFIIPKGSVVLDGLSLTVNEVNDGEFSVLLIPHTLEITTMSDVKVGDKINLEYDQFAKYMVNYIENRDQE